MHPAFLLVCKNPVICRLDVMVIKNRSKLMLTFYPFRNTYQQQSSSSCTQFKCIFYRLALLLNKNNSTLPRIIKGQKEGSASLFMQNIANTYFTYLYYPTKELQFCLHIFYLKSIIIYLIFHAIEQSLIFQTCSHDQNLTRQQRNSFYYHVYKSMSSCLCLHVMHIPIQKIACTYLCPNYIMYFYP